jgi:hypothetical protein
VSPRISASLLGEYILATEERRGHILMDQRSPGLDLPYFRAAQATISSYLLSIPKPEQVILTKIDALASLQQMARGQEVKIGDNIEALAAFLEHPGRAFLDRLATLPGPGQSMLMVGGVSVSLAPEIVVLDPGTNSFGFLKLRLCREEFSGEVSELVTALLVAYAQSCATCANCTLNLDLTCVVDVFGGKIYRGSQLTLGKWALIQAACREIAARWPFIPTRRNHALSRRRTK